MSEEAKNQAAEAGLKARVDKIASDAQMLGASISRRGTFVAWALIILCAVIAIYLGVIYANLRRNLHPEGVVNLAARRLPEDEKLIQQMKDAVPDALGLLDQDLLRLRAELSDLTDQLADKLNEQIIPTLMDHLEPQMEELRDKKATQMREELARKLKEQAPAHIASLEPRLAELKPKVVAWTEWLGDTLVEQAPAVVNKLRGLLIGRMPWARDRLLDMARERLAESVGQLDEVVDKAVRVVVDQHKQDMVTLSGEDLSRKLQASFEEAAGPVLDEVADPVGLAIKEVRTDLEDMVARAPDGLTEEERFELRLVQLVNTYFQVREFDEE